MTATKVLPAAKRKPPNAGKGRVKGVPNKNTTQLKDMLLRALSESGGVNYLVKRANDPKTASAFLTLLGKVLPMQIAGDADNPVGLSVTVRYVDPPQRD